MTFTVYRSSAGSGKTFILVKEYLKIILREPDDFRHILAITFTNKAANEMKERVLGNLKKLSEFDKNPEDRKTADLLRILEEETTLGENEIIRRSTLVLKKILHHYADFAIGTIDSFSHRIIRTFAHDFGLPVNFTVELDTDDLLNTAVDLLLDRIGDDPGLTALLQHFVESRMEEDRDWDIGKVLTDFARNLMDEQALEHLPKLRNLSLENFSRIARSVFARVQSFEKQLREIAWAANSTIRHHEIPNGAFANGDKGIGKYFERLASGRFDKIRPNSFVVKTISEGKWHSGKATAGEKDRISAVSQTLEEAYHRIEKMLDDDYPQYILLKLLTRSIYPLTVLNEIGKILDEFKKQNNLIHISEFNARIARIVLGEPVPFIYERVGEKYHHLLIDEFQDTSTLQWQNFVPLIENALSAGYFNLVVGDGKQAIYRWRNGDVEQFANLPDLPFSKENPVVRQREQVFKTHYEERRLDRNYRSGRHLVDFNNAFFEHLSPLLDPVRARVYDKLDQEPDPAKGEGYIRIEFLERPDGEETIREVNLKKVYEIISSCNADGFSLSDLAILCRSNRNASEIARYLAGQGVPVISSESLLLVHSMKVRFLVALITFLFEPGSNVLTAEILTWLFRNGRLGETGFHSLMTLAGSADKTGKNFLKILSENGINLRTEYLRALPLYDLCEELIRLFSLNRVSDPYLEFFLENVLKYALKHPAGASEFLKWWEKQKEKLSVIIPEGMDAVKIMTIHKAKGLQFPVVIFPFATESLKNTKRYLWVDLVNREVPGLTAAILPISKEMDETQFATLRQEEEQKSLLDMLNLLYVAMTRPESGLFILTESPPKSDDSPRSLPAFFASFLKQRELWSEEKKVYEFGKRETFPPRKDEPEVTGGETPDVFPDDWRNKIYIRSHAPEMWDVQDPERNRRWGNLLHTVLSKISDYTETDRVITEMQLSGMIGREMVEAIREMVKQLMENPEIRPFFEPGREIRSEAEILLPDGNLLRPDRVILDGKTATVIDYKSGKTNEKYRIQLDIYEKQLREMGFTDVKKYLLYFEPHVKLERCE
ncbi:MAG: UvrD-helicase domain-containing protein [bacterium]